MADPATSEEAAPSGKASVKAGEPSASAPSEVDGKTFANTKQHVASRQADGMTVERFTNTRLNIALINDPKNGPRFTMTKRESGMSEADQRGRTPDAEKNAADDTSVRQEASAPKEEASSNAGQERSAAAEAKALDSREPAAEPAVQRAEAPAPKLGAFSALRPAGVPPGAEPPSKVPIDSSKTFIGRNGTYYDESWRWMDWRGTRRSWNWPAALSLGHWFAYRRLYALAGLHLLWLAGLIAGAVNGVPMLAVAALALLGVGLTGVYGNTLYFLAFRRAVDHVTEKGEGSYDELTGQLAAAGGTSVPATGVMVVLSLAGIAAALAVTYHLRGGFAFNFWPFF